MANSCRDYHRETAGCLYIHPGMRNRAAVSILREERRCFRRRSHPPSVKKAVAGGCTGGRKLGIRQSLGDCLPMKQGLARFRWSRRRRYPPLTARRRRLCALTYDRTVLGHGGIMCDHGNCGGRQHGKPSAGIPGSGTGKYVFCGIPGIAGSGCSISLTLFRVCYDHWLERWPRNLRGAPPVGRGGVRVYQVAYMFFAYLGAVLSAWSFSGDPDLLNSLMALQICSACGCRVRRNQAQTVEKGTIKHQKNKN